MREPRAGPGRRNILRIVRVGTVALLAPNDGRAGVAVARFDSQNLRHLALLDVEAAGHFGADRRAFGRVLSDVWMIRRAPAQPPAHRGAGGFHISQANRAALFFIGGEQLWAAPSGERRSELPRKINGISHAGVHAEAARGDDQMRGVSGDENAAVRVTLRAEQMLRPLVHGKHFELDRHPQRLLENFRDFAIAGCGCMQGPVAGAVLENDEREYGSLSDVVVAALAHRNALVQFRAVEKRLPQLSNVAFALQLDAHLLSNGAGASIASNQVRCSN